MKNDCLIGRTFGRLTVISLDDTPSRRKKYICKCECGNICSVRADGLTSGNTQSCGCLRKERQSEANVKEIAPGTVFSRYTVIKKVESDQASGQWYLCRCECGTEKIVRGTYLRTGRIQSCGCLRKERQLEAVSKHGGYKNRLYHVWDGMIQRCTNPKHPSYGYYGGRGIEVCDEWLHSFEAFREWALVNGYDESAGQWECTLDREDTDGGYNPSNCRWVTQQVQMNNTRRCSKVTIDGVTKNLTQWAQEIGIDRNRLYKAKMRGKDVSEYIETIMRGVNGGNES